MVDRYLTGFHRLATKVGLSTKSENIPIFPSDAMSWKDTAWWHMMQRSSYVKGKFEKMPVCL